MPGILLFFDISGGELMLILLVAFLVFGPSKIPEIARKVGRGMNEIRRASDEIKKEISKEARKLEQEVDVDGTVFKDMKKTADDLKNEMNGISRSANDPPGSSPAGPPDKAKTDDLKG